ncbi:137_t:CDS:2, partial [Racocetra fulgida]
DSEDTINKLFDNIQLLDENLKAPNNTNVAEAAHALSNQREKGYKLDKERFTTINIHQQYNISQQGCITESEDTNESSNEG